MSDLTKRVIRVPISHQPEADSRLSTHRRRARGQAAVVIALSAILLIIVLGLAIDGGSMYAQRRNAQNSADAASVAAAKEMLNRYDQMILDYQFDVDGTVTDDLAIDNRLTQMAQQHGIARDQIEAYYVRDDKQIIVDTQIGSLGYVPWTQGAKGIVVNNRAETDSFFMRMLGWNRVGANATSTAFMGIIVDSSTGIPVLPVGFFTTTENLNNLVVGEEYDLIDSDITTTIGSGNWGYIDFNGTASASVVNAWMACGFNPAVLTTDQWGEWCPSNANSGQSIGPTQHFACIDHPDCLYPEDDPTFVPYLRWGVGDNGWWLAGQTGTRNSNCQELRDLVQDLGQRRYLVPIFDMWDPWSGGTNGANARFHLAAIALFEITDAEVNCSPSGRQNPHWYIRGTFLNFYLPGGTGRHGDLRHTSGHTVFLDN